MKTNAQLDSSAPTLANTMLSDAVFRPMLFSTPMVQALLAGRKTQTRRICKLQPDADCYYIREFSSGILTMNYNQGDENPKLKTPVNVGDIIWVRETFEIHNCIFDEGLIEIKKYRYKATDETTLNGWKPSLFMPKSACRIWNHVSNVRVERLHDITEQDAIDEGIICEWVELTTMTFSAMDYLTEKMRFDFSARDSYKSLWIKINGQKSWDENPFVWVYDFEVSLDCPHGFR